MIRAFNFLEDVVREPDRPKRFGWACNICLAENIYCLSRMVFQVKDSLASHNGEILVRLDEQAVGLAGAKERTVSLI